MTKGTRVFMGGSSLLYKTTMQGLVAKDIAVMEIKCLQFNT